MNQIMTHSSNDTCASSELEAIHTVQANELLQGNKCIVIQHGQSHYMLRLTRSNKLILTK